MNTYNYSNLASALRKIVWAYALIHLHFNLNRLDILPDWLGYILIVSVLPVLNEYVPSARLLRPFGMFLVIWNIYQWGAKFVGDEFLPPLVGTVVGIISVYFTFQLLTNIAEIAENTHTGNPETIRTLRNIDAVLVTMLCLPFPWDAIENLGFIGLILLVFAFGIVVGIFFSLNGMKKDLQALADQKLTEPETLEE